MYLARRHGREHVRRNRRVVHVTSDTAAAEVARHRKGEGVTGRVHEDLRATGTRARPMSRREPHAGGGDVTHRHGKSDHSLSGQDHGAERLPQQREAWVGLGLDPAPLREIDELNGRLRDM